MESGAPLYPVGFDGQETDFDIQFSMDLGLM